MIETLAIGEKKFEAQKVILSLTGFKGMLWSCCYWFRKEDGLFLKYEGRMERQNMTTRVYDNLYREKVRKRFCPRACAKRFRILRDARVYEAVLQFKNRG